MSRTVRDAGDRGLLIDCADLREVLGLAAAIRAAEIRGVVEVIPAAQTVLLTLVGHADRPSIREQIASIEAHADVDADGDEHVIGVTYDGEDLDDVAEHLGTSRDEVIARHTTARYSVAFGGFAPGFAYLADDDADLEVPRRSSPRTSIPAGSVGLAGAFSGIYPRSSPGGWQLIGTTSAVLWDADRDPAALLQPGDTVRFVDLDSDDADSVTEGRAEPGREPEPEGEAPEAPATGEPALRVVNPGLQALIQDGGRPASAGIGAPPAGALDHHALVMANHLVGNRPAAPAIEIVMGNAEFEALRDITVAVTGPPADIEVLRVDGHTSTLGDMRAIALSAGDVLVIGELTAGMRSMLAVRGGVDADTVEGSVSADTLSGIGADPLQAGDDIVPGGFVIDAVGLPEPWGEPPANEVTVPIVIGPRDDWFTDDAVDLLMSQPWTVSGDLDRVGIRLEGEHELERADDSELPSEGVVTGSLQVPANGQPVLFLNDHPVTGGYPVIAVVQSSALSTLAQVRPGTTLRFERVDPDGQHDSD